MINNKNFIGLTIIFIIILSLLTITNFLNLSNNQQLSLVIEKSSDVAYDCLLIKNEGSYQKFLNKYDVKDTKKKDFLKYDYIVSFIPYKTALKIESVEVIGNNDVTIFFETKPQVEENSDKVLIYFIPIAKNAISTLKNVKQIYK